MLIILYTLHYPHGYGNSMPKVTTSTIVKVGVHQPVNNNEQQKGMKFSMGKSARSNGL